MHGLEFGGWISINTVLKVWNTGLAYLLDTCYMHIYVLYMHELKLYDTYCTCTIHTLWKQRFIPTAEEYRREMMSTANGMSCTLPVLCIYCMYIQYK